MLSPVSMEPPTPPPQPSPSAFSSQPSSTTYAPYKQQHQYQQPQHYSTSSSQSFSTDGKNTSYSYNNGIGHASENQFQYEGQSVYDSQTQSVRSPELKIYGHKGPISPASSTNFDRHGRSLSSSGTSVSAAPMPQSNINIITSATGRQPRPDHRVADDDLALQR